MRILSIFYFIAKEKHFRMIQNNLNNVMNVQKQICLRWAYEQGISIVVKSFNKYRMKNNLEIFNWSLSEDEVNKINEIPQSRFCCGKDYISKYGPFKTIEELWDGEDWLIFIYNFFSYSGLIHWEIIVLCLSVFTLLTAPMVSIPQQHDITSAELCKFTLFPKYVIANYN